MGAETTFTLLDDNYHYNCYYYYDYDYCYCDGGFLGTESDDWWPITAECVAGGHCGAA